MTFPIRWPHQQGAGAGCHIVDVTVDGAAKQGVHNLGAVGRPDWLLNALSLADVPAH